jgi:hypothetical protein
MEIPSFIPFVALGYSTVHLGPEVTAILFLFTLVSPFLFGWFYKKREKIDTA